MAFLFHYFRHPLVTLVVALGIATGLLGYSGTGPTNQPVLEEYPISLAMRGEYVLAMNEVNPATAELIDVTAQRFQTVQEEGFPAVQTVKLEPAGNVKPEKPEPVVPTVSVHRVAPGENLYTIASKFGIDVNTILGANELEDINRISVGQELRILSQKGVMHTIKSGENLWEVARQYKVSIDDIIGANGIEDAGRLKVGQELFVPGGTPTKDLNYYRSKAGPEFIWPVRGRISSKYGQRWGRMHHGIDIAVVTGTRVKASASGRVSFAGYSTSYGYLVILKHDNGYETRYAHNSKLLVKTGQRVNQGQVVALSGNTGRSTGPHLHFEIRVNNNTRDPLKILK